MQVLKKRIPYFISKFSGSAVGFYNRYKHAEIKVQIKLRYVYQQKEAMFEVFVGLDAAVLRPLVVQGPRGVEEWNVAVPAGAEINLLQLQLVGRVQVLLRVPQHSAIQGLTCGGQQRDVCLLLFVQMESV